MPILRHTSYSLIFFFFNDPATTEIYTLSLHDALPITTEIFPGTPGGIGRLIQQTALALEHAGRPPVLLLDVPDAAADTFRAYARRMLPLTSCLRVQELLTGLSPDEDLPLWAFQFPEY